jgi:hypothetical protein
MARSSQALLRRSRRTARQYCDKIRAALPPLWHLAASAFAGVLSRARMDDIE